MSHLHLPDGILPIWLWLLGYIILSLFLLGISLTVKKYTLEKKIPLIGMLSALMIISMSIELPIGYHINLAALSGILLGPAFSLLSMLVVNVFLAFLGHGGVTTIAVNTLILTAEASIAWALFNGLKCINIKQNIKTFFSVFFALMLSTVISVTVFYVGTKEFNVLHTHSEEQVETTTQEHEIDFRKFLLLISGIGVVGWTIEAFISSFIIGYILKVKPELLSDKEESNETA